MEFHPAGASPDQHAVETRRSDAGGGSPSVAFPRDVVIVIDRDAIITHPPIGANLGGYLREELVGMDALQLVHPDDLVRAVDELTAAILDPDYCTTIEMRLEDADGHWVPVELVATSRLDDPSVAGIVVNVRSFQRTVR